MIFSQRVLIPPIVEFVNIHKNNVLPSKYDLKLGF
jgi:hypothetical protein